MSVLEEKISNLSVMEQSVQQLLGQKKNFQSELLEVESALKELSGDDSFKIVGNFMFKRSSDSLRKELEEKKGLLGVRIKSLEKQEAELEAKFKELQSQVMNELSKKKGEGD